MPRASADKRGRNEGEGGGMMRRQSRRSLSRQRDPAINGGGQLVPGQGIAWVDRRRTEGEASSTAAVLGIGLSREQRYTLVKFACC
jgi:hypothetical protein